VIIELHTILRFQAFLPPPSLIRDITPSPFSQEHSIKPADIPETLSSFLS